MAKDVDLSSKEWRDLVFEGKNKEFGAYELRAASPHRHTWAVLSVVIVTIVIVALVLFWAQISKLIAPEVEQPKTTVEQEMVEIADDVVEDVPEEEEELPYEQPEVEEVIQEEVLNAEKMSEIMIVPDDQVVDDIKSQDDAQNTETAVSTYTQDQGVDDIINAQTHQEVVIVEEKKPEPPAEDKVFDSVEQDPQFPGGQGALLKYVADHIKYPSVPQENNIQGRVVLQFVVTRDGSVGQVKVVKKVHPDLDAEAVRVVKSLPKFTPGKMNGHPVNVWFTLPVVFKLQGV